jgi:tRNA (guanine37-N1)-methyltransferase
MNFEVITLFPEMFTALSRHGVSGRALNKGLYKINLTNPRSFTTDIHNSVDDRPYGGGPGMLMMYQPLKKAVEKIRSNISGSSYIVYLSPQGKSVTQDKLTQLTKNKNLILVCGRYEGIDERFIEAIVDEEISVGDFVVSGGELPAMMLMDGIIRLLPKALGHSLSAKEDSFVDGLLDCPHYTRPAEVDGMKVPDILLQGNHAKINDWRQEKKIKQTRLKRPDLYEIYISDK